MLKFTERPKTPGITSKKTWFSLKGMLQQIAGGIEPLDCVLPNVLQSKWLSRPLKTLRLYLFVLSSYVYADWLVWAFKITLI